MTKRNFPFLSNLYKNYDKFSHGCDYLSLSLDNYECINDFFNLRIKTLDTDNSNYGILDLFWEVLTIQKLKSPTWYAYIYSISFNSVSIPIFNINVFDERNVNFTWTLGVIQFYWSYFRIIELDWFWDSFVSNIEKRFSDLYISRYDYRFDFISSWYVKFPDISKIFEKIRKWRKIKKYESSWTDELESFSIWNKVNKNSFIRFYNKKIELNDNLKKLFLYWDIFKDINTFHRLEYEFGIKFTWTHKFKDIDLLKQSVFDYTWFKEVSWLRYYKPRNVVDLSDEMQKLRYIKQFVTMWRNLQLNWVDIYSLFLPNKN